MPRELATKALLNAGAEGLPGEPGGGAESKGVDDVIILQPLSDDPPGVEDLVFTIIGPAIGDSDQASGEVEGAPNSEAPEKGLREVDPAVHERDDSGDDKEEGDVDLKKFPIL